MKNKNTILFLIGYILLVICSMFNRVLVLKNIFSVLKIISTICLIVSIVISYRKINFKVIPTILLIVISLIVSYKSNDYLIFRLCLVLLASKNISFDEFIKIDFRTRLSFVIMVLLFHFIGLTNDYIVIRSNGLIRNSMGFSHPNTFGFYLMILCFEYIYMKVKNKERIRLLSYLLIGGVLYIIDYFSDSRSSILALLLLVVFMIFGRGTFKRLSKSKFSVLLFSSAFIILTGLSFYITHLVSINSPFGLYINQITSGRFYYTNYFYNTYGIKLFGQKILLISTEQAKLTNTSALILDNIYMHILIRYGIAFFIIIEELFRKSIKSIINDKNFELFVIMIIILIYGFTESAIIRIEMCPFLLYLGNVLFKKSGDNNESN